MQQGAAILDANGCIVYCNLSLAGLLNLPREGVINRYLHEFVDSADRSSYQKLLQESKTGSSEGEVHLPLADGSLRSASFSFSLLSREKTATGVLITDLTPQKQQMEFASRLQNMQDEERRRIARELHDSVGQLLAAIGMNMEIVRAQSDKLDAKAQRAFNDNAMMVEQVSSEIRTISHLLHPPLLDLAGLASALRWYVDGFSTRSNIKVDLEIPETLGRLPAEMEIAIFRMVQECLTNIHRHSGSSTATISLSQEGERVLVQVRDMGRGIPLEKQRDLIEAGRGGVGLGGMRERLRQLGGTLEIKSGETGTTIIATLIVA
jgi:signal transduction histidine kinase